MHSPGARKGSSPDPLTLNSPDDIDCIQVSTPNRDPSTSTPTRRIQPALTPASRRRAAKPVVEIASPRKRRQGTKDDILDSEGKRIRTPLARASPSSNRATPTPNAKASGNGKEKALVIPYKSASRPPQFSNPASAGQARPTPASSVAKALPTPSPASQLRKRPRLSEPPSRSMPNFDEAFDDPLKPLDSVSRDTFLANEALRRQREARNFVFDGDVDSPKFTRSGKVVRGAEGADDEVDEYGEGVEVDHELERSDPSPGILRSDVSLDPRPLHAPSPRTTKLTTLSAVVPLPTGARPYILQILSTLTSQSITSNPLPLWDEEKIEALQGMVNLLKGTVERGEGNSALIIGARGAGKTRTVARALNLLPSTSRSPPIIVRLSGLAQTSDRLAIREMGRQIAEAEGKVVQDEEELTEEEAVEGEEYAPTTLPSHLLALLTAPSPRSIIIVIEEFDLFTEHARQALLYCLLDVVQSVKTGPVETTGRGVAVIGITCRTDTLLLLEKRVKSRFSHRMWRIASPLSAEGPGWKKVIKRALLPWEHTDGQGSKEDKHTKHWKEDWGFAVDMLLKDERIMRNLDRLSSLTTDVRTIFKPFILPLSQILTAQLDFLNVPFLAESILSQIEGAGWGLQTFKLKGLSQPSLGVLIISKHLAYAGREEFDFAQVEEEYLRFARTKLVGSGKTRWPVGVLRTAFDHLLGLGILVSCGTGSVRPAFARVRCTISPHEVVGWFKGEGGTGLGPELVSWGRIMGGHV